MSLWLIMKKDYQNNLLLILLAILLLAACSATTRYQILSGIFDGVPDPNAKLKEISDSTKVDTSFTQKDLLPTKILEPKFIYHPPYQNRMCYGCHNMQMGNALIKPIPDLCYNCHENITEENSVLHGPVAMGDCNVCHSAHLAENKFLLKRKSRDLCLFCHEVEAVNENKNHFATEEYECLDCHDPHSGKDRFLLN